MELTNDASQVALPNRCFDNAFKEFYKRLQRGEEVYYVLGTMTLQIPGKSAGQMAHAWVLSNNKVIDTTPFHFGNACLRIDQIPGARYRYEPIKVYSAQDLVNHYGPLMGFDENLPDEEILRHLFEKGLSGFPEDEDDWSPYEDKYIENFDRNE